jgi:hypothetical protein
VTIGRQRIRNAGLLKKVQGLDNSSAIYGGFSASNSRPGRLLAKAATLRIEDRCPRKVFADRVSESRFDMSSQAGSSGGGYLLIGTILGGLIGFATFIGAYIYCISEYGFLVASVWNLGRHRRRTCAVPLGTNRCRDRRPSCPDQWPLTVDLGFTGRRACVPIELRPRQSS